MDLGERVVKIFRFLLRHYEILIVVLLALSSVASAVFKGVREARARKAQVERSRRPTSSVDEAQIEEAPEPEPMIIYESPPAYPLRERRRAEEGPAASEMLQSRRARVPDITTISDLAIRRDIEESGLPARARPGEELVVSSQPTFVTEAGAAEPYEDAAEVEAGAAAAAGRGPAVALLGGDLRNVVLSVEVLGSPVALRAPGGLRAGAF